MVFSLPPNKFLPKLILVTAFLASIIGCSVLKTEHYFLPSTEDISPADQTDDTLYPNKPENVLLLKQDGLEMEISTKTHKDKLIAVGPCCPLPYIPCLFNTAERNRVQIVFRFSGESSLIDNIELQPDKCLIEVNDKAKIPPILNSPKTGLVGVVLNLIYDVNPREVESFNLYMNGLFVGGKQIKLPVIKFERTSNFVYRLS